jgi:hypothetical protein
MRGYRSASRAPLRLASGLLLALALSLALVPSAVAEEGVGTSFSHRMAQGRFFLDSGLWQQALTEFRAAAAMPTGQGDPEVHTLLARTAYRTGDIAGAVDAVRTARALSDGGVSSDLAELHEFLTTRFGKVLVIGAGSADAHLPAPVMPILDPELKGVFERAVRRLDEPASSGSTSTYLPVGSYRVGSHLVEVRPEGTARMDLRPTVGLATGGVYGEQRGAGRTRAGAGTRPRLPRPLAAPASWFEVLVAGQAFGQQGNGTGGGSVLVGWEGHAALPVGLRVLGGLSVGRLERITAEASAPPGFQPVLQLGGGPVLRPGRLLLMPWITFSAGYGHPVESALPEGYRGPVHYVVFGPDIDVRLALPAATTRSGEQVRAEVGLSFLVRESRPLGPGSEADPRPHLSLGAGLQVGLLIGQVLEVGS